jgi:penicillin amidase
VVARDRLFQLEIQARATAGTLSEVLGERALGADRSAREMGLAWSARRDWDDLADRPELRGLIEAYGEGVNAFIESLDRRDWPLEYHLLGVEPMRWEPLHTLYLLKRMGQTLASGTNEGTKAAIARLVGREAADALVPVNSPIQEPIQPHRGARVLGAVIPPPGPPESEGPESVTAALAGPGGAGVGVPWRGPGAGARGTGPEVPVSIAWVLDAAGVPQGISPEELSILGSNNWVVGPDRSTTGSPILAGDPHLQLTLPSIWYEAHLVVNGELDVYGVSLMGTPGVVIGFNRDIAWTFTNTGQDVLDYYREQLDDPVAPRRYLLDGAWEELTLRVEEYHGPDGSVLLTDTIYHTHRGPVRFAGDEREPRSMRWTVLEGQGEVEALLRANVAASVEEWLEATQSWVAPTQNGLVADRHGSIAVRSQGRYPVRPGGVAGDRVFDGTTRASDWVGDLEWVPTAVDPEQGFLATANQQPVDPDDDPAVMGDGWMSPWRALKINELLRSKERHSADDLTAYQTHPVGARAEYFVPAFLEAAEAVVTGGAAWDGDAEALRAAAEALAAWDGGYQPDNTGTRLFEAAMVELQIRLWDELEDERGRRVMTPNSEIAWQLLAQPESPWWDDRSTPQVETANDIVAASLERAYSGLVAELGIPGGAAWRWGAYRFARVNSLLGIEALSRSGLSVQGGPELLNPSFGGGGAGASWRMVVELGNPVRARATYPGGQSANPVSSSYTDRLDDWVAGTLQDLRYPASAASLESDGLTRARASFRPGGER